MVKDWVEESQRFLVEGVSSPVRAFRAAGVPPLHLTEGQGACVKDVQGRSYIDYGLGWGSVILGHASRPVISAISRRAARGYYFGTTSPEEILLAGELVAAIPCLEKVRFTVSGTEAVMGALRLARGATGRNTVVMFEHNYHGHADHLLAKAGSGLSTYGIPVSEGVPAEFLRHTVVLPYGDRRALAEVFRSRGKDIAAVIFEPVGGNHGVRPPEKGFLQYLRQVTRQNRALLVADEVITGFRFGYGSFLLSQNIVPDLVCLGKIIGGGLPVGAYGGPAELMDHLAPSGRVYQASTFSGHPLAMTAGLATLRQLRSRRLRYAALGEYARTLTERMVALAGQNSVEIRVAQYGPMFSVRFPQEGRFKIFYRTLLQEGIFLAPSEFEANFISFAHTRQHWTRTVRAFAKALAVPG